METIAGLLQNTVLGGSTFASGLHSLSMYLIPLLAFWIVLRCARSLLTFRSQPEIWAWLNCHGETSIPVTHWENVIGSSKKADIVIQDGSIKKSHAVLTRYDDDSWTISDIGSRGGVEVDGKKVAIKAIGYGDVFSLGGLDFALEPLSDSELKEQRRRRIKPGKQVRAVPTLILLSVFQILCLLEMLRGTAPEYAASVFGGILTLLAAEWVIYAFFRLIGRTGYEVESLAFFLCTLGVLVIAAKAPSAIRKELLAGGIGLLLYLFVGWSLRSLEAAKKVRYLAAVGGIGLLLVNVIFGTVLNGARNWIEIAGFSFQPSELVKVCFVFVGASTMERIVARRNLFLFIGYSGFICLALAYISDFGSALIFFIAFLIIAFLRSGDFAGLALICAGTAFAGTLVLKFRPYVLSRFAAWGHVWEYANESGGYQQTRSMMCIASGGLFGLGSGNGFMKYVAASDTDLVFALLSEEWGLLLAISAVAAIVVLVVFVVKSVAVSRSAFFTIGACASVTILASQTIMNVFGTVDILPLTGVTFPFVSNGGSSLMASWGLLGFIKAADTRQNASFATRLQPRKQSN